MDNNKIFDFLIQKLNTSKEYVPLIKNYFILNHYIKSLY